MLASLHSQARLDFNDQRGESGLLWNQIMKWYSKQKCDASNAVVNTERCIKLSGSRWNLNIVTWMQVADGFQHAAFIFIAPFFLFLHHLLLFHPHFAFFHLAQKSLLYHFLLIWSPMCRPVGWVGLHFCFSSLYHLCLCSPSNPLKDFFQSPKMFLTLKKINDFLSFSPLMIWESNFHSTKHEIEHWVRNSYHGILTPSFLIQLRIFHFIKVDFYTHQQEGNDFPG